MNLPLHHDVFRRRGLRRARIDPGLLLGADAYVVPDPAGFVTGLRDWRRTPATSTAHRAEDIDGDWRPL